MLTISKALSASQAEIYHREEFANAKANYYSEGESIKGEWHGKLAEQFWRRATPDVTNPTPAMAVFVNSARSGPAGSEWRNTFLEA